MKSRSMAGLLALAVSAGLLFAGAPAARASSKGRLNTTYALGAATIYSLLQHKTTQGVILGLGTAYAYKRYNDAHRAERRRSRYYAARYYGSRYRYSHVRRHGYR
jgi:hypothetical protein